MRSLALTGGALMTAVGTLVDATVLLDDIIPGAVR
jgi:hypothetical protein